MIFLIARMSNTEIDYKYSQAEANSSKKGYKSSVFFPYCVMLSV